MASEQENHFGGMCLLAFAVAIFVAIFIAVAYRAGGAPGIAEPNELIQESERENMNNELSYSVDGHLLNSEGHIALGYDVPYVCFMGKHLKDRANASLKRLQAKPSPADLSDEELTDSALLLIALSNFPRELIDYEAMMQLRDKVIIEVRARRTLMQEVRNAD